MRNWGWHSLPPRCQGPLALARHDGEATAVAYAPAGRRLATAGGKRGDWGEIKLWHTSDGGLQRKWTGHREPIVSLSFSNDGSLLASASSDGVTIWDVSKGIELL